MVAGRPIAAGRALYERAGEAGRRLRRAGRIAIGPRWTLTVTGLGVLAGAVVFAVAATVFPYHSINHDEGVYLQQAAMLLEGQLFLHPPVEGVFRPWFFVDSAAGLYPRYAPVPAAMVAPALAVGLPRLALAAIGGGIVALVAVLGDQLFDRPTGLLAGLVVLASPLFLVDAAVFLPYAPTTLLNLAFATAYIRADRSGSRRFAALAGGASGLAFFARPYTAVLFAAPFVVHALWTMRTRERSVIVRQGTVAAVGLLGVAVTLGYNTVVTGSPLVFPYLAFAPEDGLGFGHHELLDHGVDYTPALALAANRRALWAYATEWVAAGLLGTGAAVAGLLATLAWRRTAARLALAGLVVSVPVGEAYFWGTYNVLGDLSNPNDGLIAALGPYYHFDLLVPTAVFAAAGVVFAARRGREVLDGRFGRRGVAAGTLAALAVSGLVAGPATVGAASDPIERNGAITDYYAAAYEPFEPAPPANAVVLLADPYGPWLNHPFQAVRNDPGFDGRTVYALDDRPFAVASAYPDRRLYRYVYRGSWTPGVGDQISPRLQRVRHASGERVAVTAIVGVPDAAVLVSMRLQSGRDTARYTVTDPGETLSARVTVANGTATLTGPAVEEPVSVPVEDRDLLSWTLFVDYGTGAGFSYEVDTPVALTGGTVRALTPSLEYCVVAHRCNGQAAYLPGETPEDVFVNATLEGDGG